MSYSIITLLIDEQEIDINLDEYIPVGEDISKEFKEQAAKYAYIAVLAAEAEALYRQSNVDVKRVYADTDQVVRMDLADIGGKVTEAMVSSEVENRRSYVQAKDAELYYQRQHLIMRAVENAMKMRADMLVSLGAQLRNEAEQLGMITKKKIQKLQGR